MFESWILPWKDLCRGKSEQSDQWHENSSSGQGEPPGAWLCAGEAPRGSKPRGSKYCGTATHTARKLCKWFTLGTFFSLSGGPHHFQRVFGVSWNLGFDLLCLTTGELCLSDVNWEDFSQDHGWERETRGVLGVWVKFYLPLFTNKRFFFPSYNNFFFRVAEEKSI